MEEVILSKEVIQTFSAGHIVHNNYDYINSLDFSEDGSLLLSSSNDDSIHIYNVSSSSKERLLQDRPFGPAHAKFTVNKNILYSNRKGKVGLIKQIRMYDQSVISLFVSHEKPITCLDLSLYNTFVSASKDNTIKL